VIRSLRIRGDILPRKDTVYGWDRHTGTDPRQGRDDRTGLDVGLVDQCARPDLRRLDRRAIGADRAGPENLGSVANQDMISDQNLGSGCHVRVQGVGHDRGIVQDIRAATDLDDATLSIESCVRRDEARCTDNHGMSVDDVSRGVNVGRQLGCRAVGQRQSVRANRGIADGIVEERVELRL
jgi:hypothetical protein